ncbi:hypothetical protein FQR65_LT20344 [Abscondita terminalis]|nr:hypothetical protein FQR65_LT20344 [Abscondita terminalis]
MYVWMDAEYNQYEVEAANMGDAINYLEDGMEAEVVFYRRARPSRWNCPPPCVREIQPGRAAVKGDTSGKVLKPAKIATGFEVPVPLPPPPASQAQGDACQCTRWNDPLSCRRRTEYSALAGTAALGLAAPPSCVRRPRPITLGHLTRAPASSGPMGEYAVMGATSSVEKINAAERRAGPPSS